MAYLHPGVYLEEIPSGSKPIEGVATSVAAFVGQATKGPVGEAELIQSFDDYSNLYGDVASESDAMGFAVQSFYLNGGKSAFVCRIAGDGSLAATDDITGQGSGTAPVLVISASSEGAWGNAVYYRIIKHDPDATSFDFEVGHRQLNQQGKEEFVTDEFYNDLTMRAGDANYALPIVNEVSSRVQLAIGSAADPDVANQLQAASLTGGKLDGANVSLFSGGIVGRMSLTLEINGLGTEQVTLDAATLGLAGAHNADGDKVAAALAAAVHGLSLDAAHQGFSCTYNNGTNRFELGSPIDDSRASLDVFPGNLARLLRLDNSNRAKLVGAAIATAPTKFSAGVPGLAQPMAMNLNIDNLGAFDISLQASDIVLIGDNAADGAAVARAIEDAVKAYNPAVAAYKEFSCEYLSSRKFELTSGGGNPRLSGLAIADGELANLLKLQSVDTTLEVGRELEQGTSDVIPVHALGPHDLGVTLAGGTEIEATSNDYTEFYNSKLRKVRDVSIVILPGQPWAADGTGNPFVSATLAHCEKMKSRVIIIDPPAGHELDQAATVNMMALPSSTYSALYYPWVKVRNPFYHAETNPAADKFIHIAPSSFAAGMWSRIDARRGVWKAPAGMGAGLIGAAGLQYTIEDGEQDQLNPLGINCYRTMPGGGRVIWGARTLATKADPEWRYVPVRRTAIMIEQSIFEGIQWAVFEPNDHRLWAALRGNIGGFMNSLFRVGAFQGEKASDAYFVRCALGDTMTQTDIDAGQVIVIVGFAPLKPAEFVIVRVQQKVNQQ